MLRFLGATMTGRMRKTVAVETLRAVYAARRIQRWFRRRTQGNDRCPISLERVRYPYVSVRTTRLTFVRYNMHPFHEYLCAQTGGVVREPTTNTAISPRTMRRIVRRMHAYGYTVRPVGATAAASVAECLENVVDTLMTEALDDDAAFSDDGFREWADNMERATVALAAQSRSAARLKREQCIASCHCTPLCAERVALGMPPCMHPATRRVLEGLAHATTRR
jgi:hypothetical protein